MKSMKLLLLLAAAATAVVALDPPLPPCTACLKDNEASFKGTSPAKPKAWCYSTKTCVDLSWDNPAPWLTLFSSCPDYSFDESSCMCRPDVYTSCDTCATVSHLGCIWVANASVTNSINYTFFGHAFAPINSSHYWKEGRCVRGMGFSPLGLEEVQQYGNSSTLFSLKYTKTTRPMDWFWAQCSLSGVKMAGLFVGLLGLLCGLTCLCCCCCYAKKRRNQQFLVTQNGLLNVTAR